MIILAALREVAGDIWEDDYQDGEGAYLAHPSHDEWVGTLRLHVTEAEIALTGLTEAQACAVLAALRGAS